mmetsp:Transcript_8224/g.17106  ORF Transcript_8224/g.17106 Transcript_8224/m.17106 type:complete len:330 (+) Transcript_8224:53-1042(+)
MSASSDQQEAGAENILLVKVGGSSITEKGKSETLDLESLVWFAETISSAINDAYLSAAMYDRSDNPAMVIVHGAGSFGHHTAKNFGLRGQVSPPSDELHLTKKLLTGIAQTRHSVKKLNSAVVSHLIEKGVNAVGISPCLNIPGLMAHGGDEYSGATLLVQSIRESLSVGLVPVIHGDAGLYGKYCDPNTRDRYLSMSAGILSGDTLVEIIATHPLMNARISKAVFLTDVQGVYTKDPKICPDAVLVRNIFIDPLTGEVMNELSASGSTHEHDVTGGLEAKLGVAATVAKSGIDVLVAKCGSTNAVIAIVEAVLETNSHDITLIRKYGR